MPLLDLPPRPRCWSGASCSKRRIRRPRQARRRLQRWSWRPKPPQPLHRVRQWCPSFTPRLAAWHRVRAEHPRPAERRRQAPRQVPQRAPSQALRQRQPRRSSHRRSQRSVSASAERQQQCALAAKTMPRIAPSAPKRWWVVSESAANRSSDDSGSVVVGTVDTGQRVAPRVEYEGNQNGFPLSPVVSA